MPTNHEVAAARRVLAHWYADHGDVHRCMIQLSKAIEAEHAPVPAAAAVIGAHGTVTQIRETRCGQQLHGLDTWTCALPAGHAGMFHETPEGDRWRTRTREHLTQTTDQL